MDYELRHYRRQLGSSTGDVIAKHPIDATDDIAAIAASHQYLGNLCHRTDFAVLWGADGKFVRRWGTDHA